MSEAPKKIWVDRYRYVYNVDAYGATPYIRADIVDELVEALEAICGDGIYRVDMELHSKARAALAKLEENHE